MVTFEFTVQDELGLHARPAGLLVSEAQKYQSDITLKVSRSGKEASLKKLLAVMGLAVKGGDSVTVTVSGADEQAAAASIERWMRENLG